MHIYIFQSSIVVKEHQNFQHLTTEMLEGMGDNWGIHGRTAQATDTLSPNSWVNLPVAGIF